MNRFSLVASLALCALSFTAARATNYTLIDDTFDRTGNLNGSSPTFSLTPEMWTSDSAITTSTASGGEALIPTASSGNAADTQPAADLAYIPIPGLTGGNLTLGVTYTLSFTEIETGGASWLAIGFGTITNDTNVPYEGGNPAENGTGGNSSAFFLIDTSSSQNPRATQISGLVPSSGDYNLLRPTGLTQSGTENVVMTIDETSPGNYTLTSTVNGTLLLNAPETGLTAVTDVFLGDYQATGDFQNFELTESPEPGTWTMMGAGAILLLWRLRRQNRAV